MHTIKRILATYPVESRTWLMQIGRRILKIERFPMWVYIACTLLVLTINIAFFLTYPINIGLSDCPNYIRMMASGSSNLVHASGYSALIHWILELFSLSPKGDPLSDVVWLAQIQRIQLIMHLGLLAVSVWVCAMIFSRPAAALIGFLWGCSVPFICNVNTAAPEWLQGHLILLSLILSAYAQSADGRRKPLFYTISALLFAMAYLTKYNSLVFAPVLVLLLIFDRASWRFKLLQWIASVVVYTVVVQWYAAIFHYKSTGTKQLTYDHAWVLAMSLPSNYLNKSPELLGLNSLRWAALRAITPPDYNRSHAYPHVAYGASGEEGNRATLNRILAMPHSELAEFVRLHPLSDAPYNSDTSAPLYYYYGLPFTDALGVKMFAESLQSDYIAYMKRVSSLYWSLLVTSPVPEMQVVPTFTKPLGLEFGSPNFVVGRIVIKPPVGRNPYGAGYYSPREDCSIWGVKFFEVVTRWKIVPIVYTALMLIVIVSLFLPTEYSGRWTARFFSIGLLIFIAASGMLLGMRSKELVTITPLYYVVFGSALANLACFSKVSASRCMQ